MEQQIDDEEGRDHDQDDDLVDDEGEEEDDQGEEEQMLGEGEGEDDMIELDEEQLHQLLLQHQQQNQMAI